MSAVDAAAAASVTTGGRTRRFSTRLFRSELRLIITRRRNIAGLGLLCAVPIILAIVLATTRPTGGSESAFLDVAYGNGLFVVLATMTMQMVMMLPLAVSIVSGDAIAGEANVGSLRYLLTVPVGRTRLLLTKFIAVSLCSMVAVAAIAVTAAVSGLIAFGGGRMLTLSGSQVSFGESVWRVGLVCLYVMAVLIALAAVGLFVSTLTEQPIAAAVSTLMFVVLNYILSMITALDWLHPYLLTNYWNEWGGLLRDPVSMDQMDAGLLSSAVYTALFLSAAWARLTTKDITS